MGFFDGTALGKPSGCGAGALLHLNTSCYIRIHLNLGIRSNTRGELCALWFLLYFAHIRQVSSLTIYGDSSYIISWAKGESPLNVMLLSFWKDAVRKLILGLEHSHFSHIFREVNSEANLLSKQALFSPAGIIFWEEWRGDLQFSSGSIYMHWS